MSGAHIETIRLARATLQPNLWNPNVMTEEECEELKKEIQHLGRVPKPVVVRSTGDGYEIVDGEQSWRASEGILDELDCEIIEADDFEAMRQTYKRNQHGKHNLVKQGQMFQKMIAARGISQRELAEQVELSEGTVRNSLLYAEVAEKFHGNAIRIPPLSIKQVRFLAVLPVHLGTRWLLEGADADELKKSTSSYWKLREYFPATRNRNLGSMPADNQDLMAIFQGIEESGLDKYARSGFSRTAKIMGEWLLLEMEFARNGISTKEVREYAKWHYQGKWYVKELDWMKDTLRLLIDTDSTPAKFLITPEEFEKGIKESKAQYRHEFTEELKAFIYEKTGKLIERNRNAETILAEAEMKQAPEWVRVSIAPAELRYAIWKADSFSDFTDEVKKAALARIGQHYTAHEPWHLAASHELQKQVAIEKSGESEERSEGQIAMDIALALGLYDSKAEEERIKWLARRLTPLNKSELRVILGAVQNCYWMSFIVKKVKNTTSLPRDTEECVTVTQPEDAPALAEAVV